MRSEPRRRWRFYETRSGGRPVRDFLDSLSDSDASAILEEMRSVARHGMREGRRSQILLALEGFSKKTRQTPKQTLALAQRRLADWRSRGRH